MTSSFYLFQDHKNVSEKHAYGWETDNPEDNLFLLVTV